MVNSLVSPYIRSANIWNRILYQRIAEEIWEKRERILNFHFHFYPSVPHVMSGDVFGLEVERDFSADSKDVKKLGDGKK